AGRAGQQGRARHHGRGGPSGRRPQSSTAHVPGPRLHRYSASRRLSPQAQPAAITSAATMTPGSNPVKASAPALALAAKAAWPAAIPAPKSADSFVNAVPASLGPEPRADRTAAAWLALSSSVRSLACAAYHDCASRTAAVAPPDAWL